MRFLLTLTSLLLLACNPVRADDNEFLDSSTGKTWTPSYYQMGGGASTRDVALQVAANFVTTNYSDWRLPTLAELNQFAADGTLSYINTHSVYAPITSTTRLFWASDGKGVKGWTLRVQFDAVGNVVSYSSYQVRHPSYIDFYMVRP